MAWHVVIGFPNGTKPAGKRRLDDEVEIALWIAPLMWSLKRVTGHIFPTGLACYFDPDVLGYSVLPLVFLGRGDGFRWKGDDVGLSTTWLIPEWMPAVPSAGGSSTDGANQKILTHVST
jgi:hypothetical protein